MKDDRRFVRPRKQLVEQLRKKGIEDERVLQAIGKIPRHKLIDTALHTKAYNDKIGRASCRGKSVDLGEGR